MKTRLQIQYADVKLVSKPVPHTADLPLPLLPILGNIDEDMSSISSNRSVVSKQKKYVEEDVTPDT